MSTNPSSDSRKRFLLIRTDRVGDTILTFPAVTALRNNATQKRSFHFWHSPIHCSPVIEQYTGIDLLLSYEPEGCHKGWKGVLETQSSNCGNLILTRQYFFIPDRN